MKRKWIAVAAVVLMVSGCGGVDDSLTVLADGGTACTDTWSSYGATFFSSNCRTCHEHTSQFGTAAAVQASLTSIQSEISTGKMPEGTSLSSSERTRILTYLACGAP